MYCITKHGAVCCQDVNTCCTFGCVLSWYAANLSVPYRESRQCLNLWYCSSVIVAICTTTPEKEHKNNNNVRSLHCDNAGVLQSARCWRLRGRQGLRQSDQSRTLRRRHRRWCDDWQLAELCRILTHWRIQDCSSSCKCTTMICQVCHSEHFLNSVTHCGGNLWYIVIVYSFWCWKQ